LAVRLRPHVKTHKTLEGARLQLGRDDGPITVSTLAEARQFAAWGFRDITYAVPISPGRVEELEAFFQQGCRLTILLDSEITLNAVEDYARRFKKVVSVFLKLDCGYHRAGVQPTDPKAVTLAASMHDSAAIDFRGVLSHAGHSYSCVDRAGILKVAEEERSVTVAFANRLREAGVEVPEVSVGSTPTCSVVENLDGVTEIRPGNYLFFDGYQAAIGSCETSDIALSVLTTVIGSYPERNCVLVDSGALALSKDPGARHVTGGMPTFGLVCDPKSLRPLPGVRLGGLSQEHGQIEVEAGAPWDELRVGNKLRIIPNHSCLTAALFEQYWMVDGGGVVGSWKPIRGW
jgi:D-serine deaminase-like pyridoxal phosphate-dependent protein